MTIHFSRTSETSRSWFSVVVNDLLQSGLLAGAFTVTLINPDDDASTLLAVSESSIKPGVYYFDFPSAFLTTHGVGKYIAVVEIENEEPLIQLTALTTAFVTQEDIDTVAGEILVLQNSLIAAVLTAAPGSTTSLVLTNATQANDFYTGLVLVVRSASGTVARRISGYSTTDGAFTLDPVLPFAPSSGDQVVVLGQLGVTASTGSGGVIDPETLTKIAEIWQLLGLDPESPLSVSKTKQEVGNIVLNHAEVGENVIVQRGD
jgi:hypothetical protein